MRRWLKRSAFVLVVLLVALGWLLYFHNAAVAARLPKWGWLQRTIARVGQSGSVAAPQLHFELRKGAEAVDPLGELGPQGA